MTSTGRTATNCGFPLPGTERSLAAFSTNSAADRYYLLGRHYWNKRDEHAYSDAIEMFQKATVADPAYAAASVGLADSYMLASGTHVDRLSQDLPRAKKALEKAIQIDQELGEAHASMAMIAESYDFDWRTAEREFRTAIRLAPNYLTGHHWYAEFLTMTGRFRESEAEFEVARNLDPASMIVLTDLAQLYNFEKKYRRSLETLDEALKIDPSFHLAHYRKAYALMLMRRPQEAEDEFQMGGHELSMSERAWVAAVAGKRQQAVELASRAEKDHPDLFVLCVAWTELRNLDRAFQLLEGLCDRRMGGVVSIKVNPVFDALRSDARFSGMLRRVNLN